MNNNIHIVDNGRGPQLSTSRVTVQDLLPYFRDGCTSDEIREWIPTLSDDEIAVAEAYYVANRAEVLQLESQIEERNAQRRISSAAKKLYQQGQTKMDSLREQFAKGKAVGEPK